MRTTLLMVLCSWATLGNLHGQVQTLSIGIHDGTGEDTFVASGASYQNSNYSTIPSLTIYGWTNGGQLGVKRAFLKFDLSLIPEPFELVGARLSLYYNPDDAIESADTHTGDNNWVIQRVTGEWNPAAITWNTQPTVSNTNEVLMPATTSGDQDFEDIDVTALVQDMLSTGRSGFRLSMVTEQPYRMLILASGEDSDPDLHPRLDIDFISTVGVAGTPKEQEWRATWVGQDQLQVIGSGVDASGARLTVVDAMGRSVQRDFVRQDRLLLDASTWADGPYAVVVEHQGVRTTLRTVKGY